MNVRFANFYGAKGKAGPALDIYDTPMGQAATPLVTNLAYGAVSDYVHPKLPQGALPNAIASMYALPTGEDPVAKMTDAQGIGGVQDDGSHPQITMVFTSDSGSDPTTTPLEGLSFSSQVEKGDFNGTKAPLAPAPPSGQGELLVDTAPVQDLNLGLYLVNGSSCAPPINGDSDVKGVPYIFAADDSPIKSSFPLFPTSPGTHQVSVVSWSSSTQPACAQLTSKQGTTSIDVADGQQILVFVYGTSATDLHLVSAPIKQ